MGGEIVERSYHITVRVPLGRRSGTLRFIEAGSKICGMLSMLGSEQPFSGTLDLQGRVAFTGRICSPFYTFSYRAEGHIAGDEIFLTVNGGRFQFSITGRQAAEQEPSHELH